MSFTLKTFGSGIRIFRCEVSWERYENMLSLQQELQLPWEILIYHSQFLATLRIKNWQKMVQESELIGLEIQSRNSLELKKKGKLLGKINSIELIQNSTLFPLYQTSERQLDWKSNESHKRFYIVQTEIGKIHHLSFTAEYFEIDQLHFELMRFQSKVYFTSLLYPSILFKSRKTDALVRSTMFVWDDLDRITLDDAEISL